MRRESRTSTPVIAEWPISSQHLLQLNQTVYSFHFIATLQPTNNHSHLFNIQQMYNILEKKYCIFFSSSMRTCNKTSIHTACARGGEFMVADNLCCFLDFVLKENQKQRNSINVQLFTRQQHNALSSIIRAVIGAGTLASFHMHLYIL